jgi:hypothetical protein
MSGGLQIGLSYLGYSQMERWEGPWRDVAELTYQWMGGWWSRVSEGNLDWLLYDCSIHFCILLATCIPIVVLLP